MSKHRFIAIEIGGTSTRLVHTSNLEKLSLDDFYIFPTTSSFEADYQKVQTYIDRQIPILGIGISIPGDLNEDKSMVSYAVNTPQYVNKPLCKLLSEKYKCKVRMDNDAIVAALGEALYGTAQQTDFIYIIWGTGIGGASVVYDEGRPTAKIIDWQTYLQKWEETFGGNSLNRIYKKPAEFLSEEEWKKVMGGFSKEILFLADKLKPKRIIFGGGIATKQSRRLLQLVADLQQKHLASLPSLEVSKLGEDAELYGALGLLQKP